MTKATPKRYRSEPTDSRGRWRVIHVPSGLAVVPAFSALARAIRKCDADQIAKHCERVAPTDDPAEAGRLLGRDFVERVKIAVDPRHAPTDYARAFPA